MESYVLYSKLIFLKTNFPLIMLSFFLYNFQLNSILCSVVVVQYLLKVFVDMDIPVGGIH